MEICGKKILFVCKETYSYPLYYIAQKWKEKNEIAAFFFNPVETKLNKCLLNDTTYYNYKRHKDIKLYTSNRIADLFAKYQKNPPINYEYLKGIEKKYTKYKGLNGQILSTQLFTRNYHYRNYMFPVSYEQQMYWLELNYRNIISILDEFNPDYIIDCDVAELARMVLLEVCTDKKIAYLSLESTRYESYRTITFTLGIKNDNYFIRKYKENYLLSDNVLKDEIAYIDNFRNETRIMSKEYSSDRTSKYDAVNFIETMRHIYSSYIYSVVDQDIKARNFFKKLKNPILLGNSIEFIKFNIRIEFMRNRLLKNNKYFENPIPGEKYIYMPLHLIPESSTFVKAPYYINELSVIEAVSKSLPIGWYLYVKEHQSMVGERGTDFYIRASKFPNVKLVQLNYYKDPKPWIINSMGVVTITGTTAYEAALLGKPALVFGEIPFSLMEGVIKVNNFEDLPSLISDFSDYQVDKHSCAAYIKTVKDLGININMLGIMDVSLHNIRKKRVLSDELKEELNQLENLYLRYMNENFIKEIEE